MINMYSMFMMAEEAAEESSLFSADQMGGYAATILITVFNVLLVFLFFKFVLFKPILGIIKKREEQINSNIANAEKQEEEAKANADKSKQAIDDARAEAAQILEDARASADEQAAIIKQKAKDEASEMISRAENEVVRMKRVAIEEMKDEISDLSVEVAGRVIGDVVEHDKLKTLADKHVQDLIKEEVDEVEQ